MSAQGRGAEGIEHDVYPTPAWCVRRMLEAAPWHGLSTRDGKPDPFRVLEPCAGEGAIVRELRKVYSGARIDAIELRDVGLIKGATHSIYGVDAIKQCETWLPCDLVFTNPPFSLWYEFAKRGVASARWCALLLRIGALAHCKRHGLPTPSLYVLPNRPSFVALWKCNRSDEAAGRMLAPCGWQEYREPFESTRGKRCPKCGGKISRTASDGSEYAWFVWGPQTPSVTILPDTPQHERKGLVLEAAA